MDVYSLVGGNLILPLFDSVTGNKARAYMEVLERSQWFDTTRIRKEQNRRLRALIKYAFQSVPYYRRMFRTLKLQPSDIKDMEDLKKLPLLEKPTIKNVFRDMISASYPKKYVRKGSTGGSTGEPLGFCTTNENRDWSNAARYLGWSWAGFKWGDKYAQFFGSPVDLPAFESVKGKLASLLKRRQTFNAYRWTESDMKNFANRMAKSKPDVVYGNAVPIALMAKFIEAQKIKGIQAKVVIIDSNKLFEHEEKLIEQVFHCPIWWNYHNRENGTFGSECSEHDGYHLFAQNFIFEFIRDGESVASGETGNIVVTDLHNHVMPFLRYVVGDLGTCPAATCSCGRKLPLMKKLHGRRADILVTEAGNFIVDPFYQFAAFFDIANIKKYQIVQETERKIVVKIIPDEDFLECDTERIRNLVHFVMGKGMDVDVQVSQTIGSSKSGKRKTIIRKFPVTFDA